MTYTLPPLPYETRDLEPYISEEIMTLHHTKHHQAYVKALNTATNQYANAASAKERISLQAALKFNGGGQYPTYLTSDHHMRLTRGRHLVDRVPLIPYSSHSRSH